jgi:hypothetical protein
VMRWCFDESVECSILDSLIPFRCPCIINAQVVVLTRGQVLEAMRRCFDECVAERRPLRGFGALLRMTKGTELQWAIRMVELQFEQARPRPRPPPAHSRVVVIMPSDSTVGSVTPLPAIPSSCPAPHSYGGRSEPS